MGPSTRRWRSRSRRAWWRSSDPGARKASVLTVSRYGAWSIRRGRTELRSVPGDAGGARELPDLDGVAQPSALHRRSDGGERRAVVGDGHGRVGLRRRDDDARRPARHVDMAHAEAIARRREQGAVTAKSQRARGRAARLFVRMVEEQLAGPDVPHVNRALDRDDREA